MVVFDTIDINDSDIGSLTLIGDSPYAMPLAHDVRSHMRHIASMIVNDSLLKFSLHSILNRLVVTE